MRHVLKMKFLLTFALLNQDFNFHFLLVIKHMKFRLLRFPLLVYLTCITEGEVLLFNQEKDFHYVGQSNIWQAIVDTSTVGNSRL
jgi:hypothetical protein